MGCLKSHSGSLAVLAVAAALVIGIAAGGVDAAGVSEEDVPATSVVPATGGSSAVSSPAASSKPAPSAPAAAAKPKRKSTHAKSAAPEVEPAAARLRLVTDAWVYASPSKSSKKIEQVHKDKFVVVSGATRSYLQVSLKSGQTAYLDPSAVDLIKPTDKIFLLTQDAAVVDQPNKWGKKVAAVHRGHSVHVIGIALNYMQIKMKSGLAGFIPITALQ